MLGGLDTYGRQLFVVQACCEVQIVLEVNRLLDGTALLACHWLGIITRINFMHNANSEGVTEAGLKALSGTDSHGA